MEPKTNAAFGEWAKATARGRSMRELARLSGISHTRISDMQFGVIPSYRLLERYCEVLELPAEERAEGFRLASYSAQDVAATSAGADLLWDGLQQLQAEHPDKLIPLPRLKGGWRQITPEQVDLLLDDMRDKIRRGVL